MYKEGMRLRDRPIMLDNTGPHRPFNVKRKSTLPKQPSRTGSAKLTMQDFVRMDPGYTPNIEHLVFPTRKRNPQQVAPINQPAQKTRSRLAEMFALSRHLQQRSADRESKNRVPVINRSVDSALEGRPVSGASSGPPQRSGTIAGDPRRWLQQHQQSEEPVRQRISPIADADMKAARAPNVSVLHLRNSTDSWENNAKLPTANSRIYPSSRKPAGVHCLTKHQSLGGIESKFRWGGKSIETGDMNSSEVFLDNQYNRELSPVRWCNREVDGVYLGRSGWVQVQHKSLDDRKMSNFRTTAKVTQAQDSKRVALKLSQYHYKSEPGRCPNSPTKLLQQPQKPLYLSIKEPVKFDEIKKKSPQNNTDSFSPPPHTPIISPPPAFQDKATTKTSPKRTFFGKGHFLPRSNAIDRDVSPPTSPPKEVFKTCAPMATITPKPRVSPKTSPSNEKQQKKPEKKNILQAKSLEETSATRRSKFFQKHAESSSSSSASSMGFRSLDSCVSRPTMPRLSEITDSSLDVYEDADDEDNNSSSINMSITGIDQKAPLEVLRNREKMLANIQNSKQNQYRNPLRRSPAGSECNKQLNCSSSSTESIDLPTRNSSAATPQNRRSPLNRYIQSRSPQEEIAQKVRRSKSLQLPERKPGGAVDRGGRRVSPQPPPGRNNDRNRIYNNITPLKPQSFEGVISEDVRREAEVVTEYIYGNRSRAAAQALMMHRLNNGVSAEETVEARRPTAEGITVYYIGKQRMENSRGFQRDKTPPPATNHTRISPQSRQESSSYGTNICDYWTHCGNRDSSLTRDSQFVMRSSQSYPIQHHVSLDSANVRMDRGVPENLKRRSGGVITERRVLPPQLSVRNTLTPTDFFRNGRSDQEVTDIMDRLSPSGRTTNESQERKTSPSNSRNQSNRSLDNVSNSSSSDDIWLASDRTVTKCPRNAKSSGASTPLEDLPPEKEHHVREMILTRPGSAPSQERQESFLESQQKSMSLPKSFQSAGYQQSEDVRREAEGVTEYLYGNRSRVAAQALMMHRLNNVVSADETVESRRPTAEGITVYYIGKQRMENSRGFQRDKTPPPATNHTRISPQSRQESSSYGTNICDYWTHCGNRDSSLTRDSQFVMRSSQRYPIQHHVSLDSANVRMDRGVPENLKRRSGGVITERRVLPPQLSVRNTLTPTDFFRNGRSDQEVTDIMDRLSPSGRTTNESQERKTSPSNSRNQSNRSLDNVSNSSSSDDIWLASDRTVTKCPRNAKSSGASTPLEDLPPEKEHHVREMILTRPGSAPSQDRQESFLESQQKSMSLPKSFQSAGYQQSEEFPSSNPGADSLGSSPNSRRKLLPVEVSHTAPVTPLHEGNLRRSPLRGSGDRCAKASSTPELLESTETNSRNWDKQDSKDCEIVSSRSGSKDLGRRNIPASSTESVLQKFKKSISLRFQKKSSKDSFEQGLSIAPSISKEPSEDENLIQSSSVQIEQKEEVPEQKPRFGSLIWRSSKERKRMNKAARNAKCNSGDSGIQIEMVPGCGGIGGDSSESHDTDVPADDFDSPPVLRRRPAHGRMHRPNSELFNQVLIDKFKADLKQRAHKHQRVRRSRSDLGGHRILHWDSKGSHMRNMSPLRNRPKSPQRKPPDAPEMRPPGANRRRGHLRRSLSQPLDINKLSPLMRTKTAGLRLGGQVLSEDEHDGRLGGSDDEMMSDSESSVASLNDRKKSLEMNMDEEMIVLAEAVFDHVAIEAEELAFRAGDVIEVLETTNKDWWWGSTNGKTGWFPAEFVRLRVSQEDTVEDCLAAMASGQSVTTHLRRRTSISLLSNDQVRTSVVRELVQTERDFVKALEDVAEGYIAECRKRVDMFTEEQIGTIFINLEDILRFQSAFLKDLESCVNWEAPHKSRVGDCFLRYKSGFEIYSDYCNSHPMATVLLQELYQFNNYCKFFEACRLMRGLIEIPLDGYLLTPVQRICKYPLQLAELLKYTRADHEDHDNIKEALEAMRGVAVLINERKRRMESLEKLCTWQQRVDDWEGEDLIEISSQLLYQGDVIRVKSAMWTSNITLFLFDHQIIYCKKDILKRNTYIYKGRIDLDTSEVIDIPDGKDIHIGVTVRHAIKLYSVIRDKWLLFCCRSSSDKEKWLKAFSDERRLVAQDKSEGMEFTSTAKQLARLSAKCKRKRPPHKPRASKNFKHDSAYMGSMLQLNTGTQSSHSLGRKMGTWFTFGGNKKSRHQTFDTS